MKKVLRLVSVQIGAMIGEFFSIGDVRKRKSNLLYGGIGLFVVGMAAVSFFYSYMLGQGLMIYDSIDILPSLMMAMTSVMILLTTIFKIKGTIFGFRDYDMVMSLPVSTGGIVASRIILLYLLNMVFVVIVILPMMIAYGILVNPSPIFYIMGFLTMFFIPMVPVVLASIIGTLITYLASRFRYRNFVTIVLSIFAIFMFMGISSTRGGSTEELVNMTKALSDQVNSIYPLSSFYTKAVCDADFLALSIFLGISLLSFLLYSLMIGKVFKKINSSLMTGSYRVNYQMGELKQSSPLKALYKKELKRYFSSALYVLNTGFGIVLLIFLSIAAFFVDLNTLFGDPLATLQLKQFAPMIVSFCIVTCCTTMASISLEGRNLWILKAMPVSEKTIFHSKMATNFTIIAPAFLAAVLISMTVGYGFMQGLITLIVAILCAFFTAAIGLILNLRFPNLNWTNETMVIKQSAASILSIFAGMVVVAIQFALLNRMNSFILAYLLYIIFMLVLDFILYMVLMAWGKKQFHNLQV